MKKAIVILFVAFIGGFFLIGLILPDRDFSPMENRNLAKAPAFSAQRVLSGAFESDAESYVSDQFFLRDGWTGLKAALEMLSGKKENGGVYICGDTLIERIDEPEEGRVDANLRFIDRFVEEAGVPVYLTILPTAAQIWKDKLPKGAPGLDEAAAIEYILDRTTAIPVDTLSALTAHADEPVFYRTDHHWTSLGAFYGAGALLNAMGMETPDKGSFSPETVSEDFYGTLYSKAHARSIRPDAIEVWVKDDGFKVTRYENGQETAGALYDASRLSEKDKYAFFLGGNQPLQVIETGHAGPRLLLVRDSYADCEVPFLLDSFSEIHMADLRYYRDGLVEYVKEKGIDCVVISYSIRNFAEDGNLRFLY